MNGKWYLVYQTHHYPSALFFDVYLKLENGRAIVYVSLKAKTESQAMAEAKELLPMQDIAKEADFPHIVYDIPL